MAQIEFVQKLRPMMESINLTLQIKIEHEVIIEDGFKCFMHAVEDDTTVLRKNF